MRERFFGASHAFDHSVAKWITIGVGAAIGVALLVIAILSVVGVVKDPFRKELWKRTLAWAVMAPLMIVPVLLGPGWPVTRRFEGSGVLKGAVVSLFLLAAAAGGCIVKHGEIGDSCGSSTDCDGDLICDSGLCTRICGTHSDCGCASGTTNADISLGLCSNACITVFCERVCSSSAICSGSSLCRDTGSGFSTCE